MLINGKQIGTNSEPIEMAPDNMNTNEEQESNMDQAKLAELLQKIMERLGQVEERLTKLEDGTENGEQDSELSLAEEDEAINYLLSGESGDEAVYKLTNHGKTGREGHGYDSPGELLQAIARGEA